MPMLAFHAIWLALNVLVLICSLLWATRIEPRSATRSSLGQLVIITIIQAALAGQAWLANDPALLGPRLGLFFGLVTFMSTLIPLMQLFSVLRPKSTSCNLEA